MTRPRERSLKPSMSVCRLDVRRVDASPIALWINVNRLPLDDDSSPLSLNSSAAYSSIPLFSGACPTPDLLVILRLSAPPADDRKGINLNLAGVTDGNGTAASVH
nr:hypothetical protein Itr_chr02CG03970 [Ipomoea trifida]